MKSLKSRQRMSRCFLEATMLTALASCGGGGNEPPLAALPAAVAVSAESAPPTTQTLTCAQLEGFKIGSTAIGLPTRGPVVTATKVVPASGTGSSAVAEYCLVSGRISTFDTTASSINFQVALPTAWNTKTVMFGGGGFDGVLPNVAGNLLNTTPTASTPLSRGYAVFASDGGHQSTAVLPSVDGSSFGNPDVYKN